ncbi:MAG TPA: serine/threonine-protein kinase [Dermatophilaceae bacterium]|nr:serine/threonine-protein kinase [Dermatophilaceae bacterium]
MSAPRAPGPPAPDVPGFRLHRLLGAGGTGQVYAATRTYDDRPFAVKVVSGSGEQRDQALRELEVLAQVDVEHVVRLHAALPLADGAIALVLDLVDGGSLSDVVTARGHLLPGEVVTALVPICRAVADLHERGVVHGDLSPRNVLFTADGRPVLTDLGVAVIIGEPPQAPYGTPGFVAPEVLDGQPSAPASDVYSLGAMVWHALAGSAPLPTRDRPSLGEVVPGLPAALLGLADDCLAVDPLDRPGAADAAVRLFDTALATPVRVAVGSDPATQVTHRLRVQAAELDRRATPPPPARHRRPHRWQRGRPKGWRGRWQPRWQRDGSPTRQRAVPPEYPVGYPSGHAPGHASAHPPGHGPGHASGHASGHAPGHGPGHASAHPPRRAPGSGRRLAGSAVAIAMVLVFATAGGWLAWDRRSTASRATASRSAVDAVATSPPPSLQPPVTGVNTALDREATAARASPKALVQLLADRRAAALSRRDPGLLDAVYAGRDGPAATDRRTIARLVELGTTYEQLRLPVIDATWVQGSRTEAVLRARVDTSAYLRVTQGGERVAAPARPAAPVVLTLSWTALGWRIGAVTALGASSPGASGG